MKSSQSPKAYSNVKFLKSPAARTIRLLSEFLEPLDRFTRMDITDTVVCFGSARVMPQKKASKQLHDMIRTLSNKRQFSKKDKLQLLKAKTDFEMSQYYEDATQLTYMLTKWGKTINQKRHYVVCSGGGPGIMEAANKGALEAGGKSIGLNISLPFEQESNRFISPGLSFTFHYFFMRKFWFVYLAKALVMFPGGFGTLDELMEVLTLLQTKKVTKRLPIVLYGRKYWEQVLNFPAMVKYGTISKRDLRLFRYADTPEEAFRYLRSRLSKEH